MVLKIFSARVREARLAAGMTQAQLDAALGLQPGATAKWEAGARLPQHDNLENLADVFKKPYSYFFSGEASGERVGRDSRSTEVALAGAEKGRPKGRRTSARTKNLRRRSSRTGNKWVPTVRTSPVMCEVVAIAV